MPFPPRGLKSQENPLKHRFGYAFGLSAVTGTMNSAWITLVRNDKLCTQANAKTILVNPHNTSADTETGPVCTPMSIVQNIRLTLMFSKGMSSNKEHPIKFSWTPFFAQFPEKYDASDDDTGVSVASVMQLTKDDANEDIVPLTTNKLPVVSGADDDHPLSTVNLAEAFDTHYNMTTDDAMEDTPFNNDTFHTLLAVGSNKGALKACLGKTRHVTLRYQGPQTKNFYIKKFVPRSIRRIMPFTFFGILIHVPIQTEPDSFYQDVNLTASKAHIGVKAIVRYDEWNEQHDNTM